jgi:hypothetical protein
MFPKPGRGAWSLAAVLVCSLSATLAVAADNTVNLRIGGPDAESGSVSSLTIVQSGERNLVSGIGGAASPATFAGGWNAIAITQQGSDNGLAVDARVAGGLAGDFSATVIGNNNIQEISIGQLGIAPASVTVAMSIQGDFNGSEEVIDAAGAVGLSRVVTGDGNFFVTIASVTGDVSIGDVIGGNTNTVIRDIASASAANLALSVTGNDNVLLVSSLFDPGPAAGFGTVTVSQEVRGSRNLSIVGLEGDVGSRVVRQRIVEGTIGAPAPFSSDDNTFLISAGAPGGTVDATIAGRNLEVLLFQTAGAGGQTLTVDARGSAGVGSPLAPGSGGQLTVIHGSAGPMSITQVAAPGSMLPGGTFVQAP